MYVCVCVIVMKYLQFFADVVGLAFNVDHDWNVRCICVQIILYIQ